MYISLSASVYSKVPKQSRVCLSIFEYKPCCKILFAEKKNIVINCIYSGFLKWGQYDPNGTVNVTFFMVPEQG
jgi:hypothetical protein